MKLFRKWIPTMVLGATLILSACSNGQGHSEHVHQSGSQQPTQEGANDVSSLNWMVPTFTYTNQAGQPFGSTQLQGKVYLVDFLFTRCPDVCPPLTANMAKVQQEAKKAGVDLQFVSFSVDPTFDKAEQLKTFGDTVKADYTSWNFLTGYTTEEIQKMGKETFKQEIKQLTGMKEEEAVTFQHPTTFYLVDGTGKVRKLYDGMAPNPKQIVEDAKAVIAGK